MVEQRWCLKDKNKEKDRNNEERSKNGPGESHEERTLSSASY